MMIPPEPLWKESQALAYEYFSQFSEEEMHREMSEEEGRKSHENFKQWMYEHASEELKLYWDYRSWVGDEHQLCDGKGHALLRDPDDSCSWIQDWDVNEDGYCLFNGTQKLILNTDGAPIKNPVLYKRVEDMYELE